MTMRGSMMSTKTWMHFWFSCVLSTPPRTLVFLTYDRLQAGLFSAVLSTFVIESYKDLKPQPEDSTSQALVQISTQLASFVVSSGFINSTVPSFDNEAFSDSDSPLSSVIINTLWSASLALSLITASLGILIKQSLHKFKATSSLDPQQQVKIRTFREMGLKKWRIIELSALLPHLLQFALILFFVGLSVFLYELDQIVAGVTIGMASIWAAFLIIVNITPFFSIQSPYMSFKDLVFGMENQVEQVIGQNVASTLAVLAHAQNVLQGEPLRKTFLQCFQGFDISNWMISEYILALSKGTKPSQIHGWLPPSPRDEDKTVSGIFLDLIQNDIHLDRLCATETPRNEYMTSNECPGPRTPSSVSDRRVTSVSALGNASW